MNETPLWIGWSWPWGIRISMVSYLENLGCYLVGIKIAEVKEEKSSLDGKMKWQLSSASAIMLHDAPIPAACVHDDVAPRVSEKEKQHTEHTRRVTHKILSSNDCCKALTKNFASTVAYTVTTQRSTTSTTRENVHHRTDATSSPPSPISLLSRARRHTSTTACPKSVDTIYTASREIPAAQNRQHDPC